MLHRFVILENGDEVSLSPDFTRISHLASVPKMCHIVHALLLHFLVYISLWPCILGLPGLPDLSTVSADASQQLPLVCWENLNNR